LHGFVAGGPTGWRVAIMRDRTAAHLIDVLARNFRYATGIRAAWFRSVCLALLLWSAYVIAMRELAARPVRLNLLLRGLALSVTPTP
jgi:hypothetical protein